MRPGEEGGFAEYRRLLISELERLSDENESMRGDLGRMERNLLDKLGHVESKIAMLNVKAGVWGAAAGLLPALAVAIMWMISK